MPDANGENWDEDEPPVLGNYRLQHDPSQRGEELLEEEAKSNIMDEMLMVALGAKEDKQKQQNLERNRKCFGQGMKKGFLSSVKSTTTKKKFIPQSGAKPLELSQQPSLSRDESTFIVRQKDAKPAVDNSTFVFPEVQKAMKSMEQLDPKVWMNQRFFEKLARNPKLVQGSEMQQDPKAALLKYKNDHAVSSMLREFMEFLGGHFEEMGTVSKIASTQENQCEPMQQKPPAIGTNSIPAIIDLDETRRQAIAEMQRTPDEEKQVENIVNNPELLAALSDSTFMQRLHECQKSPRDLKRLAHDPVLGPKLQLLIQHKLHTFYQKNHNISMTCGSGLRSEQQVAERMARELMDIKIEVAHLRERLRLRVGGDTTAAELEAEAFALQTALGEAQQALKVREVELQTLNHKYQKAMHGMMRLDEAWKLSKKEAKEAQDAQRIGEQLTTDEKRRGDELQRQLEASYEREKRLDCRIDALIQQKQAMQQQRDKNAQEAKDNEIKTFELRAQLETMRNQFEMQMKQQEGATREDVRRMQNELQKAEEQAAALRGEISARQEEATNVMTELKDTKQAVELTKKRLVQLTEVHAALGVHLETAKLIAVESTQRAVRAESENECLKQELEEREGEIEDKEKNIQALQEDTNQKQRKIEEVMTKKEQAVKEIEERLIKESQKLLQTQEETWTCREKLLRQEVENCQQKLACLQAFHVELAQLLQIKEEDTEGEIIESVEPAMLKALVVQEINQRDVLTTTLKHTKMKLRTIKRQLTRHKHLEAENVKLRAEYEKAKLAMERMATRKAKNISSLLYSPARIRRSDTSERSSGNEHRLAMEVEALIVKRQLDADKNDKISLRSTPRKAQRTKHVYVASRYLNSASKR
ncbi:putative STI1 domain-containing protein [Plasmopara halstedii]